MRRDRVKSQKWCAKCGNSFVGTARSHYCPGCLKEKRRTTWLTKK